MSKRKSDTAFRYEMLVDALNMNISTYETLRAHEDVYNRLSPELTGEQHLYLMSRFAAHEYNLSQQTGLGYRPTESEIASQAKSHYYRQYTRPESAEDADPFALTGPTASGQVKPKKRKRSKSEEALVSTETLDWGDFPGGSPPPPPPPGGEGGTIAI